MIKNTDDVSPAIQKAVEAMSSNKENKRELLTTASEELRHEMEQLSQRVCDLVLAQPRIELLAYTWSQFHIGVMSGLQERGKDYRPDKDLIQTFQFALEYLHAVWSCHDEIVEKGVTLNEAKVAEIFNVLEQLSSSTAMYCMASSATNIESSSSNQSADTEFHAKTSWVLLRGNRYQVLEQEFFEFVLEPHSDALRNAYHLDAAQISENIQKISDATRTGFSRALDQLQLGMDRTSAYMESTGVELKKSIETLKQNSPDFSAEMSAALSDLFNGGLCNISRHSEFTTPLLEDLSYEPGENQEFFVDGNFKGTPMRTLPARIKPGIKLQDEYYITDGQFIRDSAYRAIQRGLLKRSPIYREEWNRRQKTRIENAFPTIFKAQFTGAMIYPEVYFKDPASDHWVETDLVMCIADTLIVVEAKAGVMAMHSPATNFNRHERAIRELIIKAYDQCKRFVDYLASSTKVPLFNLVDGKYVEIAQIKLREFRKVIPIGLTVESFSPFSSMCKELSEVQPLLDKHPFISMSVDDLFVLNRFLPSVGELIHYLGVRQKIAGIPKAMLFDEIEHLGAYVTNNRYDMTIKKQLEKADMVTWDSFGDVIDQFFEGNSWKTEPAPHQEYPKQIASIFRSLEESRPNLWLEVDNYIRNLGGSARANLDGLITSLLPTLKQHPMRRLQLGEDYPFQVWVCREHAYPTEEEARYQAQVGCLTVDSPNILSVTIQYDRNAGIKGISCMTYTRPTIIQTDYDELKHEAERQKKRMVSLKKNERLAK